jgi:CHAT domain-containing protein
MEATSLARKTRDVRSLSYALGNLGVLYQNESRYEEALFLIRGALRASEEVEAPELMYRWRWREGQILWAQGRTGPAIDSYKRAVEILEETRQEALSRYGSAEVYFRKAVAPVYLDLVKALLQASEMVKDKDMSHMLLVSARGTVERLKAAELRDYFRDDCVADLESRTTSPEDVSQQAAVVYPIMLPDRLELLVTLPTGLKRFTVSAGTTEITDEVEKFRNSIQNPRSQDYLNSAQVLYNWLVSPYARELNQQKVNTIVFIPDGALRTIPMAALHDGSSFLSEKYGLVVTPGLALVDPKPMSREKPVFLLAGLSESVQGLPALPAVEGELDALKKLYGVEPIINEEFTSNRLEQEMLERPPSVVHIASHAHFSGDARTSWILTYDKRVTMDDLSGIVGVAKFREDAIELLVLSACETAAGDDRAALGLAGVALRAGARSTLGSLWTISDEATSILISNFYEALKEPGVSKAVALQRAQKRLLEDPRFKHPFFWSPFLIIGNWL